MVDLFTKFIRKSVKVHKVDKKSRTKEHYFRGHRSSIIHSNVRILSLSAGSQEIRREAASSEQPWVASSENDVCRWSLAWTVFRDARRVSALTVRCRVSGHGGHIVSLRRRNSFPAYRYHAFHGDEYDFLTLLLAHDYRVYKSVARLSRHSPVEK